jgi:iron complex outermembrane receptor protein
MKKVFLGTTALAMAALATGTAYAQTAGQSADAATPEEPTLNDDIIIVTAQRRAQDVQEIPLAVTAVGPAQLEAQGVVNVQDISQVSPSFSSSAAQLASASVVLRIRGVGTTSNNIGFESAVGIFVDGAYQSRPGIALSEFVDVERVEVLRGPQGTLFGRNTSAGALNVTNVRPDLSEFGGFANATYGNRNLVNVQGAVNLPVVKDTVAVRLTGAYRKRDGYLTVVDRNGAELGDSNGVDQHLIRGQIGWETEGGIKGRIVADYAKSKAPFGAALEVLQSPVEAFGLFGAVGLGARGGMAAPAVATDEFDIRGGQAAVDNRIASASFVPETRTKTWGVTGELEVPVGAAADLIYIGSYRKFDSFESYDADFSGLDVFDITGSIVNIKTMTHELRLQGDAFSDALEWMIGAYYSKEDITQDTSYALGEDYGELVGALFFGLTGGAFGANPLTLLSGGIDPAGSTNNNLYAQNSKSWSIFTHNTLEIADGLKVSVGMRYSDESKDGSFAQGANNNSICPALLGRLDLAELQNGNLVFPPAPAALGGPILALGCFAFVAPADLPLSAVLPLPRTFASEFKDNELIYTGKVAYEVTPDINTYASFTHGYKSGGFNLDSTAAVGGTDPRFLSETVDAYEIGLKSRLMDNAVTLNVAAFIENFQNFQVLEFTGVAFETFNVPKATSKGVEIETVIRPDDYFTISGGLTLLDTKYPDDCAGTQTAVNVVALCGQDLTNAPPLTGIVGVGYRRPIGDTLEFSINGQVRMESDQRTSTQGIVLPTAAQIDALGLQGAVDAAPLLPFDSQDGTIKINLRATIGSQDDLWRIEAFVNNLTNEVTRGVTFNTTARSGSRSAFIQEPRSFGVTVRTKF